MLVSQTKNIILFLHYKIEESLIFEIIHTQ